MLIKNLKCVIFDDERKDADELAATILEWNKENDWAEADLKYEFEVCHIFCDIPQFSHWMSEIEEKEKDYEKDKGKGKEEAPAPDKYLVFVDLRFGNDMKVGRVYLKGNEKNIRYAAVSNYISDIDDLTRGILGRVSKPVEANKKDLYHCLGEYLVWHEKMKAKDKEGKGVQFFGNTKGLPQKLKDNFLPYNDMYMVEANVDRVWIYLKNGSKIDLSANIISVKDFENKGDLREASRRTRIDRSFKKEVARFEHENFIVRHLDAPIALQEDRGSKQPEEKIIKRCINNFYP